MRRLESLALWATAGMTMFTACTVEQAGEDDEDAAPVCGDGVVNGSDECDGEQFASRTCQSEGWEDGALTCTSDCKIVADACVFLDEDFDQLSIYDEETYGTDPLNPDSDGDGVLDGAEVQGASDPLDIYSWPQGVGAWPNRIAVAEAELAGMPTGWGTIGTLIKNQPWTDQFGQYVQLHQFYGYVTVLSLGAVWCGPCNQAAATSQALFDEHRAAGVVFLEALSDGNVQGVAATQQDIEGWATTYGLQFPVMRADFSLINATSIPTFYIMDRQMIVRDVIQGFPGDPALSSAISAVVAASQ